MKSSKFQVPSSKEIPNLKFQVPRGAILALGAWLFIGAWNLELGTCHAGTIGSYPNTSTLASNDLFIIERGPGLGDYNIQAYQILQNISLLGLVASNLVDGPIPSGLLTVGTTNGGGHLLVINSGERWITYDGSLLTNVTAQIVASQGTNFGFQISRTFTNTFGRNIWVQMSNATATAVFSSLGTNVISPMSGTNNPACFPLSLGMYFTNATGGFFYFTP